MVRPLPYNQFKWVPEEEFDKVEKEIMSWDFSMTQGYILDVDLSVPVEVQESLKEYPPAPEKCEISYQDLSECNKIIFQEIYGIGKTNFKSKKLVATLKDKVSQMRIFHTFLTNTCFSFHFF